MDRYIFFFTFLYVYCHPISNAKRFYYKTNLTINIKLNLLPVNGNCTRKGRLGDADACKPDSPVKWSISPSKILIFFKMYKLKKY